MKHLYKMIKIDTKELKAKEIEQVKKEIKEATKSENHTYAQTLYFQDLLPLIKK